MTNPQKSDPSEPERLPSMTNYDEIEQATETLRRFINSPRSDQLVAWRALDVLKQALPVEQWEDVAAGETLIAGEVYRITALAPWDKYPGHRVGDTFVAKESTLYSASSAPGDFRESWCAIHDNGATSLVTGLHRACRVKSCRSCAKPLVPANCRVADGCPCNSPRGINHGLVPKNTCTCAECDPEQTGSSRAPAGAEP